MNIIDEIYDIKKEIRNIKNMMYDINDDISLAENAINIYMKDSVMPVANSNDNDNMLNEFDFENLELDLPTCVDETAIESAINSTIDTIYTIDTTNSTIDENTTDENSGVFTPDEPIEWHKKSIILMKYCESIYKLPVVNTKVEKTV